MVNVIKPHWYKLKSADEISVKLSSFHFERYVFSYTTAAPIVRAGVVHMTKIRLHKVVRLNMILFTQYAQWSQNIYCSCNKIVWAGKQSKCLNK